MLLKRLSAYEAWARPLRARPRLAHPVAAAEELFGHRVVFAKGALFAVPSEDPRSPEENLEGREASASAFDLCCRILEARKPAAVPELVDRAYGFGVYLVGSEFAACEGEEPPEAAAIRDASLPRLYEELLTRHEARVQVYLHVGLPKTGTTFLQDLVFPRLEGVHYVSRASDFFTKHILKIKFGSHPFVVDGVRQAFREYLREVDEPKILISEEAVTEPRNSARHVLPNLWALHQVFPRARVLFTVRRQADYVRSFYLQDLRVGGCMNAAAFTRYDRRTGTFGELDYGLIPRMSVHYLDWTVFIDFMVELFGREDVCPLLFEEFQKDPARYLERVYAFLGCPACDVASDTVVHEAYGAVTAGLARFLNKFVVRGDGRLGCLVQRPFLPALNRLVDRFDELFPVVDCARARIAVSRFVRRVILTARRGSQALSVDRFVSWIDRWLKAVGLNPKARVLSARQRRAIESMYREKNRRLDEKYGLGAGRYGYYGDEDER